MPQKKRSSTDPGAFDGSGLELMDSDCLDKKVGDRTIKKEFTEKILK